MFFSFASGSNSSKSGRDKRLLEMASSVKKVFESVIITAHNSAFSRSQVDVVVQVLQADGGIL